MNESVWYVPTGTELEDNSNRTWGKVTMTLTGLSPETYKVFNQINPLVAPYYFGVLRTLPPGILGIV